PRSRLLFSTHVSAPAVRSTLSLHDALPIYARLQLFRRAPRRCALSARDRKLRVQLRLLCMPNRGLFLLVVERAPRLIEMIPRLLQLECALLCIAYVLLCLSDGRFTARDTVLRQIGNPTASNEHDRGRKDDRPRSHWCHFHSGPPM